MDGMDSLGDRLSFSLPDFLRLSWVSDQAREVWKPRIKAIVATWGMMERESARYGLRRCALAKSLSQDGILADASAPQQIVVLKLGPPPDGLSAAASNEATIASEEIPSHFAIGDPSGVDELRSAWLAQDHDKIGRLLGYPPCCALAFSERRAGGALHDPIWVISNAGSSANGGSEAQIDIKAGAPSCNIFWRLLGIRAVPHLPCRFDCEATVEFGKGFLNLAHQLGFAAEIEWLMQILSWPVEWSALHGIAEIKTPILKIVTATDATARKLTVRWVGSNYPPEGAQAVRFPYQIPRRLSVTESAAYQRGLAEHVQLSGAPPAKVASS
jgi:hypothetical protein